MSFFIYNGTSYQLKEFSLGALISVAEVHYEIKRDGINGGLAELRMTRALALAALKPHGFSEAAVDALGSDDLDALARAITAANPKILGKPDFPSPAA